MRSADSVLSDPVALNIEGTRRHAAGDIAGAEAAFRHALALAENFPEAHSNLGIVLRLRGQYIEARAAFQRALDLRPDYAEALNNLGNLLRVEGNDAEALPCFERALTLNPDYGHAHNNLGMLHGAAGRFDEAEHHIRRAIALVPTLAGAHNNLGIVLQAHGQLDAALEAYDAALALKPDYVEAQSNRALCLLAAGRFAEGWRQHENRWQGPRLRSRHRHWPMPQWRGEPAEGKVILIHAEQGFGDTLQFCRYIPMVAARGLRVIVEVPLPLVRLLHGVPGIERLVVPSRPETARDLPPIHYHCPMLSLPLAFDTRLETIPAPVPYLRVHPVGIDQWRRRLAEYGEGFRVGLVWAGNPRIGAPELTAVDRRRSMPAETLRPLLDCPGVRFFSLQKDAVSNPLGLIDLTADLCDFAETAALVQGLDLVITVDTSVVHLAGGLGKPVWLLNRYDTCWRWLTGRDDSPWYPTLRQFRQPHPGDWDSVVAAAAGALRETVGRAAAE